MSLRCKRLAQSNSRSGPPECEQMKRYAVISNLAPSGAETGVKIFWTGFLRFLAGDGTAPEIIYIQVGGDEVRADLIWPSITRYFRINGPGRIRQLINALVHAFLARRCSFQEGVLFAPVIARQIQAVLKANPCEIIVYDTVRMGQYQPSLAAYAERHVLYMDDLFSLRYRRILEASRRYPEILSTALGNFERNLSPFACAVVRRSNVAIWLLRTEARLIEESEIRIADRFASIALVNDEEAAELIRRAPSARVSLVRHIFPSVSVPSRVAANIRYNEFVFLGNLNLPHNAAAVFEFIRNHWRNVKSKLPEAKLRVIGRGAPAWLERAGKEFAPEVTIEGFVPDLAGVLAESSAMVIPLTFGSGVKIKTIEALRAGIPVIATKIGVEGIAVRDGVEARVVAVDDFPEAMAAMRQPSTNEAYSRAGRLFFEQHYSFERVAAGYREFVHGDCDAARLSHR